MDDYKEPFDIERTTRQLRDAWRCIPETTFFEMLDTVFGGAYYEMTPSECEDMLNEFILQNE